MSKAVVKNKKILTQYPIIKFKKYYAFIFLFIVLLAMFLMTTAANASGLFPSTDEMFGATMPSVGLAIDRAADEQAETDAGIQEVYLNFSGEEYIAFGQYLGGIGASIKDCHTENDSMTAIISIRDDEMGFIYNWADRTATIIYPSGTRAETELEKADNGDSILPAVGGIMPSAKSAIGRKPDEQTAGEEGLTLTWNSFSNEDYNLFGAYLAETGAVLKDSSIEAGVLNAEIGLNDFSFRFIYNWNKQSADVIYPAGTTPEDSRRIESVSGVSFLPDIKTIGRKLPRICMALERESSLTEKLEDGSVQDVYFNFSEEDYNTFSLYLQEKECILVDYHMDENGLLEINLSNGTGSFTFLYDSVRSIGKAVYPEHTRVEKDFVFTPKATPAPTPKPVPTSTPTISPDEYNIYAAIFVRIVRSILNKPDSLEVHSIRIMEYKGDSYVVIDFSAMNGFGGYTRETYSFKFQLGEISLSGNSSDYDMYEKHKSEFSLIVSLDADDVMSRLNK